MIRVYGTPLCKDCTALKALYEEKNVEYEFLDFGEDLENLKEFLKIRDINPIFDPIKKEGGIGIPCILLEDGTVTLEPEDALR